MFPQALSSFSKILIPCFTCQFMVPTDVTNGEPHPRDSWCQKSSQEQLYCSCLACKQLCHKLGLTTERDQLEWQPFNSAETTKLTQTKKWTEVPRVRKHGSIHALTSPLSLTLVERRRTLSDSATLTWQDECLERSWRSATDTTS